MPHTSFPHIYSAISHLGLEVFIRHLCVHHYRLHDALVDTISHYDDDVCASLLV